MRIICKNCDATYSIAEKVIGPNGRTVKCAKCSHIWKVTPTLLQEEVNIKFNQSAGADKKIKLKVLILLLTFTFFLIAFLFFSKHLIQYNIFQPIYKKLSVYDYSNIKLSDCSFRVENDDIIIKASVTNHSKQDKKMPSVQYTLLDKNKHSVFSYIVESEIKLIKAGETVSIDNRIENIQWPIKYIKINIGNKLDFITGS